MALCTDNTLSIIQSVTTTSLKDEQFWFTVTKQRLKPFVNHYCLGSLPNDLVYIIAKYIETLETPIIKLSNTLLIDHFTNNISKICLPINANNTYDWYFLQLSPIFYPILNISTHTKLRFGL